MEINRNKVLRTISYVAPLVLELAVFFGVFAFITYQNYGAYLYPVLNLLSRIPALLLSVVGFVFVYIAFVFATRFSESKAIKVIVIALLILSILVSGVMLIFAFNSIWHSKTNDTQNFAKLDKRAQIIIDNYFSKDFFDFEEYSILKYEYRYCMGYGDELSIDYLLSLGDDEYNSWVEKMLNNEAITSTTMGDGNVRLVFQITQEMGSEEGECVFICDSKNNTVSLSLAFKYD